METSSSMSTAFGSFLIVVLVFTLQLRLGHAKTISTPSKAQLLTGGGANSKEHTHTYARTSTPKLVAEDPAVTKLRQYIRINTGPPNPDYESAIEWFRKEGDYFGLDFNLVRFQAPDLFAVWLTWKGTSPELKSILLNSHMDVVEADKEKWIHDPFDAYKDEHGNIYGRGSRDMKSTTIGQLGAIRQLQLEGFKPRRTVHVSIIPDEENGGTHGMKPFVESLEFKSLNIGFDLEESIEGTLVDGMPSFSLPYAQKSAWQFNVTAEGVTGHGSNIAANGTAGQKLNKVISRLFELKANQARKLQQEGVTQSDITSVNLVKIGGGLGNNVLPPTLWAVFDMRIRINPNDPHSWNFTDYERFLNQICAETGPGVSYTFLQKGEFVSDTSLDPDENVWWATLMDTCNQMNWTCNPWISLPTSDAGYVRNAGIPAIGFVPRIGRNELRPMHGHNEAVNEHDFLESIERYKIVLRNLAMIQ